MEDREKQELPDITARQAKEIETLRQTADALCRRISGAKSEKLEPAPASPSPRGGHGKKARSRQRPARRRPGG